MKPGPWLTLGLSLMPSIAAGVGFLLTYEHRITAIEAKLDDARSDVAEHRSADAINVHNLWYAIAKNHGDPSPPN